MREIMYAEEDDMVESLKNLHPINERTTSRRHHQYIAFNRSEIIGRSDFFFFFSQIVDC